MEKDVYKEIDETIISVSEKIRNDNLVPEFYADTVKALAALVEARARLNDESEYVCERNVSGFTCAGYGNDL